MVLHSVYIVKFFEAVHDLYIFKTLGEGRTEPIPLSIKEGKVIFHQYSAIAFLQFQQISSKFQGRGGLGQESAMKRKQEHHEKCLQVARDKRIKLEAKQREDFREKQKEIFSNKLVEKDLFQSQKACEQLDKAEV